MMQVMLPVWPPCPEVLMRRYLLLGMLLLLGIADGAHDMLRAGLPVVLATAPKRS